MIFNSIRALIKPLTIWRLKHGQIVMIASEPYRIFEPDGSEFVDVINQSNNSTEQIYLDSFYEATKIG